VQSLVRVDVGVKSTLLGLEWEFDEIVEYCAAVGEAEVNRGSAVCLV